MSCPLQLMYSESEFLLPLLTYFCFHFDYKAFYAVVFLPSMLQNFEV